jgi:hypothetical protein
VHELDGAAVLQVDTRYQHIAVFGASGFLLLLLRRFSRHSTYLLEFPTLNFKRYGEPPHRGRQDSV